MNSKILKKCGSCGASVERKDCHKNRFAEYICRQCQAAGIKASWRQRLQGLTQTMLRKVWLGMAGLSLSVLLLWMFFSFLASMAA